MRISDWSSDVCSSDLKRMIEGRTPGDLDQRLGPCRRQRTHPLAESGGQHHRRAGHLDFRAWPQRQRTATPAHAFSFHASARALAGRLASNHVRTATSAGWARLRSRRSEEHTSELQSLMRISYAVFCLKK